MNIYQVSIRESDEIPEIVATSIEEFLGKLNSRDVDQGNYYFLTNFVEIELGEDYEIK